MTGEEVARELLTVLSTELGITSQYLLATMRDRATVNNVAVRTLQVMYPDALDVGCFSHTLNNTGERFNTPILDEFVRSWISLFAHSAKAKIRWKELTGLPVCSYTETRWWSKCEVIDQLLKVFGDVEPFLTNNTDLAPTTRKKLLGFMSDTTKWSTLEFEMSVIVDAGAPLVKATYRLEGDGPLALHCFEVHHTVTLSIQHAYYPITTAIAQKLAAGNHQSFQQLMAYAKQCVQLAYEYYEYKIMRELGGILSAFKAARLFCPSKAHELQPLPNDIDALQAFPFLRHNSVLSDLKVELPTYLATVADVSDEIDPVEWWSRASPELPNWSKAARQILLVQPLSASAERVFSLLARSFNHLQDHELEDYIEASLML